MSSVPRLGKPANSCCAHNCWEPVLYRSDRFCARHLQCKLQDESGSFANRCQHVALLQDCRKKCSPLKNERFCAEHFLTVPMTEANPQHLRDAHDATKKQLEELSARLHAFEQALKPQIENRVVYSNSVGCVRSAL